MPNFKPIEKPEDVKFDHRWTDAAKFNSKDNIVTEEGKAVESTYEGRKYQLILKKERDFTGAETLGRVILGIMAVACSFGLLLLNKTIFEFFTKYKKIVRIGLLLPDQKPLPIPGASAAGASPKQPIPSPSDVHPIKVNEEQKEITKPQPPKAHPKIDAFQKLLNGKAEVFNEGMHDFTPEEITLAVKHDKFTLTGSSGYFSSYDAEARLKMIFKRLNPEQLKGFFAGIINNQINGFTIGDATLKFIHEEKDKTQKRKHLADFQAAIEENPSEQWLKSFAKCNSISLYDHLTSFFNLMLLHAIRQPDYADRLSYLKDIFKSAFDFSFKDKLVFQLTIQEWKNLEAWCEVKHVSCPSVPDELTQFQKYKSDKQKAYTLIDKQVDTGYHKKELLRVIMREMSAAEAADYVHTSAYFHSSKSYQYKWIDAYVNVVQALSPEKYQEFVSKTMGNNAVLAKEVLSKLQTLYISDAEKPHMEALRDEVQKVIDAALSQQLLDEFKEKRKLKSVSGVLEEALKDKGDRFNLIAEEMTSDEIKLYVSEKNNCFKLGDIVEKIPLQGVFKYLPAPKLKVFIEEALKWPTLKSQAFFGKLIEAAGSLEGEKQREICRHISKWFLQDPLRIYIFFPDFSGKGANEVFIAHYLKEILAAEEAKTVDFLNAAYQCNEDLVSVVIDKGFEAYGIPIDLEDENQLKLWLNAKKAEQSERLCDLKTKAEVLAAFDVRRDKPYDIRGFFGNSLTEKNKDNFKIVADVMTAEECALYATMENNCFGIFPKTNYLSDKELLMVFDQISDPVKLQALLKATLQRKDCLGCIGLYVTLILFSNSKEQSVKKALFSTIIDTVVIQGQFKNLSNEWISWNDFEGKLVEAMKEFTKVCVSKNMTTQNDLGLLVLYAK